MGDAASCTGRLSPGQGRRSCLGRIGATLLCACSALWSFGARPGPVEIVIRDYQFAPAVLQIKAGTTLTWTNREKRTTHTVLFTGPGGMESERLFPGDSWLRTFDTPGSYPYLCGPHPEMKGQIDVVP